MGFFYKKPGFFPTLVKSNYSFRGAPFLRNLFLERKSESELKVIEFVELWPGCDESELLEEQCIEGNLLGKDEFTKGVAKVVRVSGMLSLAR